MQVNKMPVAVSWTHVGDEIDKREFTGRRRFLKIFRARQFPFENDFCTRQLNSLILQSIATTRPDCVILSHWRDALPTALRKGTRLIVDAHNIESAIGFPGAPRRLSLREKFYNLRFRQRERNLFKSALMIWTTSKVDADIAKSMAPRSDVRVIPNAVDTTQYDNVRKATMISRTASHRKTKRIGYIGRFSYPPNATAAERLMNDIFPLIAARFPDLELWAIGMHPSDRMQQIASQDPRIHITGAVDEILSYLVDLDLLMVPITAGSGTRLKILEGFASGVPVVSTGKGVEGISANHSKEILIAESNHDLAEAAYTLLVDPERSERQARCAATLVQDHYSWSSVEKAVSSAIHDFNREQ